MMIRRTLSSEAVFHGVGIHSGQRTILRLLPSGPGTGIVFTRDIDGKRHSIKSDINNISNLTRSTCLSKDGISINTIEHLLFALDVCGITDAEAECDNEELPILDGSAWPFIRRILDTGTVNLGTGITELNCPAPFTVGQGDSFITYQPSTSRRLTLIMDFPNKNLSNRSIHLDLDNTDLAAAISKARTFGFEEEIKELHSKGLGLGGNLRNTVVVTRNGYRNLFLRYTDECMRHKVLDFLGDMYLHGTRCRGHFIVCRSGHRLDIEFLREFLKRSS